MIEATEKKASTWTFLTNHSHVLLCLAKNPSMRIRDLADEVNITQRAIQRIVTELLEEGYLNKERQGRRNIYSICDNRALKHPIEWHKSTSDLIQLIFD